VQRANALQLRKHTTVATARFELAAAHSFNCASAVPAALQSRRAPGLSLRGFLPPKRFAVAPIRVIRSGDRSNSIHVTPASSGLSTCIAASAATNRCDISAKFSIDGPNTGTFANAAGPEYCVRPTLPAIRQQTRHRQFDRVKPVPLWCRAARPPRRDSSENRDRCRGGVATPNGEIAATRCCWESSCSGAHRDAVSEAPTHQPERLMTVDIAYIRLPRHDQRSLGTVAGRGGRAARHHRGTGFTLSNCRWRVCWRIAGRVGRHNILEPAAFAKVPVFGPSMENFAEMSQRFVAADAAIQVDSPETPG